MRRIIVLAISLALVAVIYYAASLGHGKPYSRIGAVHLGSDSLYVVNYLKDRYVRLTGDGHLTRFETVGDSIGYSVIYPKGIEKFYVKVVFGKVREIYFASNALSDVDIVTNDSIVYAEEFIKDTIFFTIYGNRKNGFTEYRICGQ